MSNQQYSIKDLNEISLEIIEFYKSNPEIAKQQYDELINDAKSRGLDKEQLVGYYEEHHIISKCMGGTNDLDNLVLLTYREHVLAHMLLYTLNKDNRGLFLSFSLLIQVNHGDPQNGFNVNLNYLEDLKKTRSEFMKGENNPMKNPEVAKKMSQHRKGIASFAGKHHTKETRELLSKIVRERGAVGEKHPFYGKHHTPETIEKLRRNHRGGIKHMSEESRKKLSESKKQKVIGPDGTIYDSVRDAAKSIGISRATLSVYLNHKPEKVFKFL